MSSRLRRNQREEVIDYQLYHFKGSGGNKQLPPRRFSTLGIVGKFHRAPAQLPPQTSSPWCAVCPPYGVNSMDLPASMHGWPYEGVGQGHCCDKSSQNNYVPNNVPNNVPMMCWILLFLTARREPRAPHQIPRTPLPRAPRQIPQTPLEKTAHE